MAFALEGKRKILVLADDYGRYGSEFLSGYLDTAKFDILNIYKPGASLESVIEDVEALTDGYNKQDFVVLCGGIQNIISSIPVKTDRLRSALKYLQKTNVIMLGIPYWRHMPQYSAKIDIVNDLIHDQLARCYSQMVFVDLNRCLPNLNFGDLQPGTIRTRQNKLFEKLADYIEAVIKVRAAHLAGTSVYIYYNDNMDNAMRYIMEAYEQSEDYEDY